MVLVMVVSAVGFGGLAEGFRAREDAGRAGALPRGSLAGHELMRSGQDGGWGYVACWRYTYPYRRLSHERLSGHMK